MDFYLDLVKRYGLAVVLLLVAVWWQNARLDRIETRLAGCEADKFKIITDNNERSNTVINQNTIALDRNTDVLEGIQSALGIGPSIRQKKRIVPLTARQGINKE